MSSFPSFRITAARWPHWRRGFALMLTVLTALGGPVFLVIGQAQNNPSAPSASVAEQSSLALQKTARNEDVFVIYRDEKGESVCRIATPEEKRRLSRRGEAGPTRTIYPGGRRPWMDEFNAAAPAATEFGTPLLPSAGLRIVLHGTQQLQNNPTARDAFIVAANRWEALISTPITVVLDVDFGTTIFGQPFTDPNTLGSTSSSTRTAPLSTVRQQLINNAPGAEELQLYNALPATVPVELNGATTSASQVRMTLTTSRALGLSPDIPNPDFVMLGDGDAGIGFNSAHSFDFNPNDGITSGALDFDAVVVHEIGHALGFISNSGNGDATPVSIWDVFRFRPGTANLGTMTTAPRVMSEGGSQVFFNNRTNSFGTTELGLSTGGSDGQGGDGEQSSHWKDDSATNPFIGIMDPRLSPGRREVLTDNDLKALDTFGYTIGGTAPPPPPPPPAPANDNFAAAVPLSGTSGTVTGTNVGATGEAGEPDHAGATSSGRKSVWYNWTAPGSGQTTFNTLGSNYDTVLGIYTGGAVNALTLIGSNDDVDTDAGLLHSSVTFTAVAGTTYRIAVDGFQGETGSITLNWTAAAAQIDVSDFFVRQHYTDFLNRQADSSGLSFWTNNIESCGSNAACREVKRIDTSAAFFLSIEFQETGYLVYRLYKPAYGDLAGAPFPVRRAEFISDTRVIGSGVVVGQAGWEQVLEANTQNFIMGFVTRSSFTTAHPTTTAPAQFVDTLFARSGVIPSSTDRQAAINEFGGAADIADPAARARALRRVAEHPLLKAQEFNKAFVLMQYFGYLQRNPDDAPDNNLAGYNFWLTKLNQFNGDFRQAEMVKAFITSSEYRSRFGPP